MDRQVAITARDHPLEKSIPVTTQLQEGISRAEASINQCFFGWLGQQAQLLVHLCTWSHGTGCTQQRRHAQRIRCVHALSLCLVQAITSCSIIKVTTRTRNTTKKKKTLCLSAFRNPFQALFESPQPEKQPFRPSATASRPGQTGERLERRVRPWQSSL